MIKHVTLWNLKPFAAGNDRETNYKIMKERATALAKEFGKVRKLEIGRNFKSGGQNYDMVQILSFDDRQTLEEYLKYPGHLTIHEFAVEIRAERAVADFDTEE